ncbi:hypothetical protein ACLOJK_023391 [Asimina triloba]
MPVGVAESECTEEGNKEFPETPPMNDLAKKNGVGDQLLEDDEMISSFGQFRCLCALGIQIMIFINWTSHLLDSVIKEIDLSLKDPS